MALLPMTKPRLLILLLAIVCLGALTQSVALYGPQVIDGPDIKIHYRWALQFASALSEGVWYPRWASYSYFGLGDPTFLYIHPLFYYAVAAVNIVINDVWLAILTIGAMSSAVAAAATYWIAQRNTSKGMALVAACAMALSPYAFHLAHYQQFLPMHFAMPALVLFLGVISSNRMRYRVPLIAVSLALLVMSHVLVAFMALVCTAAVILWRALRERNLAINQFLQHATGVFLGLALSAMYLFPALTTQHLVSPAGWYVPIHLDWHNAFLLQYFTLPDFGFRWFHLQWSIPLLTVCVCGLSGIFLWVGRSNITDSWHKAAEMLVVAIFALLLGSEFSYSVWDHVETLRRLQFPLRFLQVACVASIFALVWSAAGIEKDRAKMVSVSITLFLVGSLAMLFALERQFSIEAKPALTLAVPGNAQRGQPEMKPASVGGAWRAYLDQGGWEAECITQRAICSRTVERTHHKIWTVEAQENVQGIHLPIFWFPGWTFLVNDRFVIPVVDSANGLPLLEITPGRTTIEARWTGIPQERVGEAISLAAVLVLAGLLFTIRYRAKNDGDRNVA